MNEGEGGGNQKITRGRALPEEGGEKFSRKSLDRSMFGGTNDRGNFIHVFFRDTLRSSIFLSLPFQSTFSLQIYYTLRRYK